MENLEKAILPGIEKILEDFFSERDYPVDIIQKTKEMIYYVIPDHFMASTALIFPEFCKILKPNLTEEELDLAQILGWISQMFQCYCYAFDDFFDEGERRFDKATWSKLYCHLKSFILPDLVILRSVAFFALKTNFSHLSSIYLQLLQLCVDSEITYYKGIRLEKELHFEGLRNGKNYLESCDVESYKLSCALISDPYLNLPIALAMAFCGFQSSKHQVLFQNLEKIGNTYTSYGCFGADYLEIFGPLKNRTDADFRKGRMSWLFLTAQKSCTTKDQFTDLLKHYGNDIDESVIYVTELLEKIGIHDLWKQYRHITTEYIEKELNTCFTGFPEVKEVISLIIVHWNKFLG